MKENNHFVAILIFLFIGGPTALAAGRCEGTSNSNLVDCINITNRSLKKMSDLSAEKACRNEFELSSGSPKYSSLLPSLTEDFRQGMADCSNFIRRAQRPEDKSWRDSLGPWGEVIVNYLDERGIEDLEQDEGGNVIASKPVVFFSNEIEGIEDICPNWKNLAIYEKEHMWVWIFAAIAHDESSCDPKRRNPNATNTVAVGLLQLEEPLAMRKNRGENCKSKEVRSVEPNLLCGLDIMEGLLTGAYKGNRKISGSGNNSYWAQLKRKRGGVVGEFVSSNPLCKPQ